MCVKHSVTYEANICEHNYIEHGGNSICLLRGRTQLRKAGTRPESWWRVNVRVPSTWVMYLAESSALLSVPGLIRGCIMPSSFHSLFACSLNWAIQTFILVSFLCVHLSQPRWLSCFFFSFPTILSHPRFVSVTQTLPPGSIRSMGMEHICLIIHYPSSA